MREMLVRSQKETGEDGVEHQFEYYVLIDEMMVKEGFACESYGVKIAEPSAGEAVSIPNITVNAGRVDELVALLTRNCVSPASLGDVVADWL